MRKPQNKSRKINISVITISYIGHCGKFFATRCYESQAISTYALNSVSAVWEEIWARDEWQLRTSCRTAGHHTPFLWSAFCISNTALGQTFPRVVKQTPDAASKLCLLICSPALQLCYGCSMYHHNFTYQNECQTEIR